MQLGRVIGTVVASERTPDLDGIKFLIVQPLDRDRKDRGEPVVAADGLAMAGPDELVYFVGSREAAQAMPEPFVPIDHAVVGIVDQLTVSRCRPRRASAARRQRATKGNDVKIARVAGTVVSTISAPIFDHQRLLFCDYLTPAGEPTGDYVIAVDTVDAGAGETVLILDEGNGRSPDHGSVNWTDPGVGRWRNRRGQFLAISTCPARRQRSRLALQ